MLPEGRPTRRIIGVFLTSVASYKYRSGSGFMHYGNIMMLFVDITLLVLFIIL